LLFSWFVVVDSPMLAKVVEEAELLELLFEGLGVGEHSWELCWVVEIGLDVFGPVWTVVEGVMKCVVGIGTKRALPAWEAAAHCV
jgi:hypothetical protein